MLDLLQPASRSRGSAAPRQLAHRPLYWRNLRLSCLVVVISCVSVLERPDLSRALESEPAAMETTESPSFARDILPIFRAQCQGCHQPAQKRGGYDMVSFEHLLAGGESGTAAIVPGKPDESYLLRQITPDASGKAEMPRDKPALSAAEIDRVRRWISAGAVNDSPSVESPFDAEHPPSYTRQPVITSMDVSPDGKWLAVSGFHEVLVFALPSDATPQLARRWIGRSARIESVRFSPDGSRLAVAGGLPGRLGEIQVWKVQEDELQLSLAHGNDSLYGASWSPDGKLIAFGAPDNGVRIIESDSGKQVLFQGAHSDWPLDTQFSLDGSHLISVGRDRTAKLIEVGTQRFIDNITSITPGVLKGGIAAIRRHPQRDEIAVASADGVPKVYGIHRHSRRVIGDDANLRRRFPAMVGRVESVAYNSDGTRLACASSDLTQGEVAVFTYLPVESIPDDIKSLQEKSPGGWSAEERARMESFHTSGVKTVTRVRTNSGMYSVVFHPQTNELYAGGLDGTIRVIDPTSGKIVREFPAAPLVDATVADSNLSALRYPELPVPSDEPVPLANANVVRLDVSPKDVTLRFPYEYRQLVVMATMKDGTTRDVTRVANISPSGANNDSTAISVSNRRRITAVGDFSGELVVAWGGHEVRVPVKTVNAGTLPPIHMMDDVMPVLSRMGCNSGTCHGSKDGKNGFKLSLRGYDVLYDTRALTDDLKSRRSNQASPEDSLFLLKATGSIPHVGGQRTRPGEPYYEILRQWIQQGATIRQSDNPITRLEIQPAAPVVERIGDLQQLRVLIHLSDGAVRDVTHEAFVDSGNSEVATIDSGALVTTLRRGEAPMLARYQGNYAVATVTVMGDRSEFTWQPSDGQSRIDELVDRKLARMKIQPAELCSDGEFLRRIHLDLTGLPPTVQEVEQFQADARDSRVKREQLIDRLIASDEFVDYWTNKWCDLLMVNSKYLAAEGATTYRNWIRGKIVDNTPYDQFVREVITANGSNREKPAAAYYKILRDPQAIMENTTQLFLGVRFNCNKCHDHPFERWTQDQYYETAAYFARVGLRKDDASGDRRIGGTEVESATPLFEVIYEKDQGEIRHDRTQAETQPQFPFRCDYSPPKQPGRREEFAAWLTSPNNPYFARSYANRIWGYLFGIGIIEPIDDTRAGNPPTNPELLEYLTRQFVTYGFDMRRLTREICRSHTYQRSFKSNRWNDDDKVNYSHAVPRRLPAEVLFDTLHRVTGSVPKIPGVPIGTRASQLADAAIELPSGFLASFGRPPRESACECERSTGMQLGPVMAMVTGPTVGEMIADPKNKITELVQSEPDDQRLVEQIFLRVLGRLPTPEEVTAAKDFAQNVLEDHVRLVDEVRRREVIAERILGDQKAEKERAIAAMQLRLDEHLQAITPIREQQERERAAREQSAMAAIETRRHELQEGAAKWEESMKPTSTAWDRLSPENVNQPAPMKSQALEDQSILIEGAATAGDVVAQFSTNPKGVTGFRLELLPDPRLSGGGPGFGSQGEFEIAEIAVAQVVPNQAPVPLPVKQVKLSYAESEGASTSLIDGKFDNAAPGWRVTRPQMQTYVATLELAEGISGDDPVKLQLTFKCVHADRIAGHFRWSSTKQASPFGPATPWQISQLIGVPAAQRNHEHRELLDRYQQATDVRLLQLTREWEQQAVPLPPDATQTTLETQLRELRERALTGDPILTRLQDDLAASTRQVENQRLTAAQDLVWALINTPSFLFNR